MGMIEYVDSFVKSIEDCKYFVLFRELISRVSSILCSLNLMEIPHPGLLASSCGYTALIGTSTQ